MKIANIKVVYVVKLVSDVSCVLELVRVKNF